MKKRVIYELGDNSNNLIGLLNLKHIPQNNDTSFLLQSKNDLNIKEYQKIIKAFKYDNISILDLYNDNNLGAIVMYLSSLFNEKDFFVDGDILPLKEIINTLNLLGGFISSIDKNKENIFYSSNPKLLLKLIEILKEKNNNIIINNINYRILDILDISSNFNINISNLINGGSIKKNVNRIPSDPKGINLLLQILEYIKELNSSGIINKEKYENSIGELRKDLMIEIDIFISSIKVNSIIEFNKISTKNIYNIIYP